MKNSLIVLVGIFLLGFVEFSATPYKNVYGRKEKVYRSSSFVKTRAKFCLYEKSLKKPKMNKRDIILVVNMPTYPINTRIRSMSI